MMMLGYYFQMKIWTIAVPPTDYLETLWSRNILQYRLCLRLRNETSHEFLPTNRAHNGRNIQSNRYYYYRIYVFSPCSCLHVKYFSFCILWFVYTGSARQGKTLRSNWYIRIEFFLAWRNWIAKRVWCWCFILFFIFYTIRWSRLFFRCCRPIKKMLKVADKGDVSWVGSEITAPYGFAAFSGCLCIFSTSIWAQPFFFSRCIALLSCRFSSLTFIFITHKHWPRLTDVSKHSKCVL